MPYETQINRISTKLILAKEADKDYRVFGASSHKYLLKPPLSTVQIIDFEEEYDVTLPDCYRSFLTKIGNGGFSFAGSGAGPFYGIYPLGKFIDQLVNNPKDYLKKPVNIYPEMTTDFWDELTKRIDEDDNISDEDYDKERGKMYSGILPIASQGCSYINALALNGEHKGKVINLDMTGYKPNFTFENNFLDWYERWLDEVISGHLISDRPVWFGYSIKDDGTEGMERQ